MEDTWEQARSHFNHGWLKNQFLAVLLKYRQVEQGLVVNDYAALDLRARLLQWREARKSAEAVIATVQDALDHDFSDDHNAPSLEIRVVRLANEVERRRWIQAGNPRLAAESALAAIAELDSAVNDALQIMVASDPSTLNSIDGALFTRLMNAGQRLSIAFSHLTLCRSIPEPA